MRCPPSTAPSSCASRLLGIPDLAYHDIYPPLVPSLKWEFPIETGKKVVVDAVMPLGREYAGVVEKGFASRWMDVYPQPGQALGCLLERLGVRRPPLRAHELQRRLRERLDAGPRVGSRDALLPREHRPSPTRRRTTRSSSPRSPRPSTRRCCSRRCSARRRPTTSGSSSSARSSRGCAGRSSARRCSRSSSCAIHETRGARRGADRGEAARRCTASCCAATTATTKGVVKIDDAYTVEWAYIPHFYYNFYVYQYATSLAASTQLAREVIDGKPGAARTLPRPPQGRRLALPLRAAQGSRCRSRRAAAVPRPGSPDELGDGRDREARRQDEVTGRGGACPRPSPEIDKTRKGGGGKPLPYAIRSESAYFFGMSIPVMRACTSARVR